MPESTNGFTDTFDDLVFGIWQAGKDGVDPETDTDGPEDPAKAIATVLSRARGAFSASEQYDALSSAEAWGLQVIAALEQDLAQARRALAALQLGPAHLMRSQIAEVNLPQ
ncbi:hypothetical protein MKK58_04545 [Methylobacterium sp. J-078]|uniref:hypothetical protein n=1 Tax=Methylobacterium sp. J-078 TaxID=2836657 RepID=UPI001FBB4672|nr:hypothetical protein [Methylobacterium sp. J-078]MCJ2043806.1 hypothetical protein [Methylobacterium sp. J-078]